MTGFFGTTWLAVQRLVGCVFLTEKLGEDRRVGCVFLDLYT